MTNNFYEHKKIFFLRPRDPLLIDLIDRLKMAGFEVYEIPSLTIMEDILLKYNNSFLFVNINDSIISEESWLYTVRGLKRKEEFKNIKVGVFHYTKDYLSRSMLVDIGIDLGFIRLFKSQAKLNHNYRIVLATLESNEALGRRKSIRISLADKNCKVGIRSNNQILTGKVLDMSYQGIACKFSEALGNEEKSRVDDLVLKWDDILITNLKGKCLLQRDDKTVIIFDKEKKSLEALRAINSRIQNCFDDRFRDEVNKITFLKTNRFHLDN